MKEVTERQYYILRHIADCIRNNELVPTIREIGDEFHISSLRGVTVHLDALQRKGCLVRSATARSMRLTPHGRQLLAARSGSAAPIPSDPRSHDSRAGAPINAAGHSAIGSIIRRLTADRDRYTKSAALLDPETRAIAIKRYRYFAANLEEIARFAAELLDAEYPEPEHTVPDVQHPLEPAK